MKDFVVTHFAVFYMNLLFFFIETFREIVRLRHDFGTVQFVLNNS